MVMNDKNDNIIIIINLNNERVGLFSLIKEQKRVVKIGLFF